MNEPDVQLPGVIPVAQDTDPASAKCPLGSLQSRPPVGQVCDADIPDELDLFW